VAARQTHQRLLHLVDRLPAREARVIRHHYLQHVSFDDIAKTLGLTPGRISQLHRRALGLLRDAMKAEGLDLLL
jgi:RNA polymerase sigma factor for flagellar operon FliA